MEVSERTAAAGGQGLVEHLILIKFSCEIKAYVETHLCELRRILRSFVLRASCDLLMDVITQGTKSDSCGIPGVCLNMLL